MKERNKTIDILKGISCIGVVLIHYPFPGKIRDYSRCINRFAVPFFFFVSGYFSSEFGKISLKRIFHRIVKILKLLFHSGIFYFIFIVIIKMFEYFNKFNIWNYFKKYISNYSLIGFILSNKNLLYNTKFIFFIIYFGIFGYFILGEFKGLGLMRNRFSIGKYKNYKLNNIFIFRALPHFMIGVFIKLKHFKIKLKKSYLLLIFLIGTLLSCLENYFFGPAFIFYIGSNFQLFSLIIISISNYKIKGKIIKILNYIGRDLSDRVYIYHIAIGEMVSLIAKKLYFYEASWFRWIKFFIIILVSLFFSILLKLIPEKIL